jgi:hypothetical protein
MWFWKMMEKISWTDCVGNEVLRNILGAEEYATYNKRKEGELDWSYLAYELPYHHHHVHEGLGVFPVSWSSK